MSCQVKLRGHIAFSIRTIKNVPSFPTQGHVRILRKPTQERGSDTRVILHVTYDEYQVLSIRRTRREPCGIGTQFWE